MRIIPHNLLSSSDLIIAASSEQSRLIKLRSRLFDYWSGFLPKDVSKWQVAFELGEMLNRAKAAGAKNSDLAAFLGVSEGWIKKVRHEHQLRRKRAPAEIYLSKLRSDLFCLTGKRPWSMMEIDARALGIQGFIGPLEDRLAFLRIELATIREFAAEMRRVEELTPALKVSNIGELAISKTEVGDETADIPTAWALEPSRQKVELARARPKKDKRPGWLNPQFPTTKKKRSKGRR